MTEFTLFFSSPRSFQPPLPARSSAMLSQCEDNQVPDLCLAPASSVSSFFFLGQDQPDFQIPSLPGPLG